MSDLITRKKDLPYDEKPISRQAFALNMARAWRATKGVQSVSIDNDRYEIKVVYKAPGDDDRRTTSTLPLEQFYLSYKDSMNLSGEIERCISLVLHARNESLFAAESFDKIAHKIYPILEPIEQFDRIEERLKEMGGRISRRWRPDLMIAYLYDTPMSRIYLHTAMAEQFHTTTEEIHHRAMQNLAALTEASEWEDDRIDSFAHALKFFSHDGFAATRVLCGATIRRTFLEIFGEIEGELVAVIPSRDTLMIIDSPSLAAGAAIRRVAHKLFGSAAIEHKLTDSMIPVPFDDEAQEME